MRRRPSGQKPMSRRELLETTIEGVRKRLAQAEISCDSRRIGAVRGELLSLETQLDKLPKEGETERGVQGRLWPRSACRRTTVISACTCGNDCLSVCENFIGDEHWVECYKCPAEGPRKATAEEARTAWNLQTAALSTDAPGGQI
jgi:hypothetical protein